MLIDMHPARICTGCQTRLNDAAKAMRRHAQEMNTAFYLLERDDALPAEQRQEFTTRLIESLQEAQSAWDTYCEHLKEHGLPPSRQLSGRDHPAA